MKNLFIVILTVLCLVIPAILAVRIADLKKDIASLQTVADTRLRLCNELNEALVEKEYLRMVPQTSDSIE